MLSTDARASGLPIDQGGASNSPSSANPRLHKQRAPDPTRGYPHSLSLQWPLSNSTHRRQQPTQKERNEPKQCRSCKGQDEEEVQVNQCSVGKIASASGIGRWLLRGSEERSQREGVTLIK